MWQGSVGLSILAVTRPSRDTARTLCQSRSNWNIAVFQTIRIGYKDWGIEAGFKTTLVMVAVVDPKWAGDDRGGGDRSSNS